MRKRTESMDDFVDDVMDKAAETILDAADIIRRADQGDPEIKMVWARYKFTEDEIRRMSQDLAEKIGRLSSVRAEAKAVAADFKARADMLEQEIGRTAGKVDAGSEMRNIECEAHPDYELGIIRYLLPGTEILVKEEAMRPSDRQLKLA